MSDIILIHTHAIMAFLLFIFVASVFFYLMTLKNNSIDIRYFKVFYLSQMVWQMSDAIRYSLHPSLIGSLFYQINVVFFTVPALIVLLTTYIQFLYLFLGSPFEKERKIVLYVVIVGALVYFGINVWNEFFNGSDLLIFTFSGFLFGLITNFWVLILGLRKWHYYKKRNNAKASNGNLFMAIVNVLFVTGCLLALIFDFYTPAGYWSYFIFIWFGNFLEVIVYINYAAVQTTVKTKLIGFTLVVQIMVLMAISLIFYPLLPPTEVDLTLTYQTGMYKILGIIIISVIILYVVFPKIIYLTITNPLEQLLKGVQNVNNGDLSTTVDISQNDEVGILTKNFNIMTSSLLLSQEKLVDYANTLEHKVTERTIQLQESLDNLKSTQSLLIQSEKLASLGELTAGIAHEIQNPLNFINNFSEVSLEMIEEIKEEREKPQDQIEHSLIDELFDDISENLKKIKNHGFRAESIVKGMLQHSRMSTGQREKTDINNLVDEYFRLAYHGLRAKDKGFNSILKPSYDKKIQKIEIVPQDIGRVVLNLFTNAFYAVNERKKQEAHDLLKVTNGQEESKDKYEPCVEVTTKWRTKRTESGENQEWIEIKVKDNGLGIPQNILEKIFQPFFTTKPAGQGTGLGLSLSYDIVKAHRGQLTVKTEVNHGTEFTIMLPAE